MLKVSLNKQKYMTKIKQSLLHSASPIGRMAVAGIATGVIAFGSFSAIYSSQPVYAQSIQEQINNLNDQNADIQSDVDQLVDEAADYKDAIQKFQTQINGLQTQIDKNTKEQQRLKAEMKKAEAELAEQKDLLGQNIRAMYVEGDMSTIEMLASSNDLSEYIDREQYRNSVKNKISETVTKINDLKKQLSEQKNKVDALLKEQNNQRAQLATSRAEQRKLLSYNESQQDGFNKKSKANQKRIAELMRQQAEQNARRYGGGGGQVGGGSYPWGNAPCLSGGHVSGYCYGYEWGYNGSYNNWNVAGYAYRNCTDYVAWKILSTRGFAPTGLGHAKSWYFNASGRFSRGSQPRVGAAAIDTSGPYGHVMYVEAVNGDGSIVISDYNRAGPGEYGRSTLSAGTASGLYYVYF
jgi:surface antigen/peptidoglycan hydrolase CwlO-like protein